jgi:mono/diheme cytochrome c family protein
VNPAGQKLFAALWIVSAIAASGEEAVFSNSLGQQFRRLPGTNVLLSVWETRARDFTAFLQANPQVRSPLPAGLTPDHPACNLTWHEATAFCRWLTRRERELGIIGPEDRYRLPTDREWGLAAGPTRYPWGHRWPPPAAVDALFDQAATPLGLIPAGRAAPNELGFHDLTGNAFEWIADWYERRMNPMELRLEYKRLEDDGGGIRFKVLRGAAWAFRDPLNLLTDYRYPTEPDRRGGLYGFRAALELGDAPSPVLKRTPARPAVSRSSTPSATAVATSPAAAAIDRGRRIFTGQCNGCHQLFDPVPYDADSWENLMRSMRAKAKLRGHEAEELDAFLRIIRGEAAPAPAR